MSHEDKRIDPRIKSIMKWQLIFLFINFAAAVFSGWWLGQQVFDPATSPVLFGLTTGLLAALLIRVLNYVTLVVLQLIHYGFNVSQLVTDAEQATDIMQGKAPVPIEKDPKVGQLDFRITKKARKPLGKFMDHYFYEWIEIASGEQTTRLYFEGTLDLKKATVKDIPADCLVLPPGIIYKPQA